MTSRTVLVLSLAEGQQRSLMRHPIWQTAGQAERDKPVTIHYDSRHLALRDLGVALFLKDSAGQWIQVVQRSPTSGCGMSHVQEWQSSYRGSFDFSDIPERDLRKALNKRTLLNHLVPIFEVSRQRVTRTVRWATDSEIRVCIERGWIVASGRRTPISEISFERVSGSVHELFQVAIELAHRHALAPVDASHVERGYRLFQNEAPAAVNARKRTLDPETSPRTAFRDFALGCLADLHANHEGAVGRDDPEYIHQMRVAIRRLRAAIRIFRPILPAEFAEQVVPPLKQLVAQLGLARDLDVLTTEIVAPVIEDSPGEPCLAEMMGVLTDQTHIARDGVKHVLSDRGYGLQLLRLGQWLHGDAFALGPEQPPLPEFAHQRLQRLDKKVRKLSALATTSSPESLHDLRIGIKYLRYGMEFLGGLNPEKKVRMRLKQLVALQEELGQLNDLANAQRVLSGSASNARLRKAAQLIGDWHEVRRARLLAGMEAHLVQFNAQHAEPDRPEIKKGKRSLIADAYDSDRLGIGSDGGT